MKAGSSKIDYGMDAPGVMRGLLGTGIALWAFVPFAAGFRLWLAAIFALTGTPPLLLGLSMLAYGHRGKHRVRDRILDAISWRGDERVLDVGTGRAFLAVGAARRAPNGRVVGIDVWRAEDLTDNSLDAARANVVAEGLTDRVEIVDGDASRLDLEDASFDVVLSLLCLHNIEPEEARRAACLEIARVLRPGGFAVIADYIKTGEYAAVFRNAGLRVVGPESWRGTALGLMAAIRVEKPA